jgi:hypothetical protein
VRSAGILEKDVEQSIENHGILRSWLLRGTLHFVAPADIHWLLELLGADIIAGNKRRYHELELDEHTLARSSEALEEALAGGAGLNRKELFTILEENGISTMGQRGVYMLQRASLLGLICQGVAPGNQPTFFSLNGIVPPAMKLQRDHALAELAKRYFTSHGPATLQDFKWWSGLSSADARAALNEIGSGFRKEIINDQPFWFSTEMPATHVKPERACLLPGFDEYLLGYQDRSASLDVPRYQRETPANGMLPATMVLNGRVTGTWKWIIKKNSVIIDFKPFEPMSASENRTFSEAAERYGNFLGLPASINIS